MKYFLFTAGNPAVTGPFKLDDIEARLQAGGLSADTLAIAETPEGLSGRNWLPIHDIPGLGQKRAPESAPLTPAAEIPFCPGGACQIPTPQPAGEAGVCDPRGKTSAVVPPSPPPLVTSPPAAGNESGGGLGVVGTVLGGIFVAILFIAGGLLFLGFLLLNLLGSLCRA